MDRKEMETKLLKHGLPTWGTDEQLSQRLTNNGIVKLKIAEANPTLKTVHAAAEAVLDAPRKMGRPKKVK